MKTPKEKITEKIVLLECVNDILGEIEWRVNSAANDLESVNTRISEYADEHDGDTSDCWFLHDREKYTSKILAYQEIEKLLEKMG